MHVAPDGLLASLSRAQKVIVADRVGDARLPKGHTELAPLQVVRNHAVVEA